MLHKLLGEDEPFKTMIYKKLIHYINWPTDIDINEDIIDELCSIKWYAGIQIKQIKNGFFIKN